MGKRRFWTDDDLATLRAMVAAGDGLASIAAALDRTRLAVATKMDRLCLHIDPEAAARRRIAVNRARRGEKRAGGYRHTPEHKARVAEAARRRDADPEYRERRLAKMRAVRRSPESRERSRQVALALVAKRMAWCPEPFRAEYRRLVVSKALTAAEARAVLEPEIKAWLRTFEGQLWRVSQGAALVPNVPIRAAIAANGPLIGSTMVNV